MRNFTVFVPRREARYTARRGAVNSGVSQTIWKAKNMKAFFVGAGASYGTLCGRPECPPVAKYFGLVLKSRHPSWETEYPGLAEVVRHLGRPIEQLGLEPIWTCIDYYAKLGRVLPVWPQWDPNATLDLKRVLLQLYGSACDKAAALLPKTNDYTLGHLFGKQLNHGDVVISFNYDTVVEQVASTFHRVLVPPSSIRRDEAIGFAKPHGSVSWCMNWTTKQIEWLTQEGGVAKAMESDQVDQQREPLVLGAVPIKSELIYEVQKMYFPAVWEVVSNQWKLVTRAIRDATSFIIVGYGFPKEDEYGRFLFREAMRLRKEQLPAVEFYELEERRSCTEASIRSAFGCDKLRPKWKKKVTPAPHSD